MGLVFSTSSVTRAPGVSSSRARSLAAGRRQLSISLSAARAGRSKSSARRPSRSRLCTSERIVEPAPMASGENGQEWLASLKSWTTALGSGS